MLQNILPTGIPISMQVWDTQNIPSAITVAKLLVYVKENRYYRKWYEDIRTDKMKREIEYTCGIKSAEMI